MGGLTKPFVPASRLTHDLHSGEPRSGTRCGVRRTIWRRKSRSRGLRWHWLAPHYGLRSYCSRARPRADG